MDRQKIENLLVQLEGDGVSDVRANPEGRRRGQFLAGWRLARLHHEPACVDLLEIRDHYDIAEQICWQRHP